MKTHWKLLFLAAIAASFAPGCALFSKAEKGVPTRFFSLDRVPEGRDADIGPSAQVQPGAGELRVGHITGATQLEERLVYRDSAFEIKYNQELRWTEPPELYLRRLLSQELFQKRGLVQVVGGAGATLDVQINVFEEIRFPQRHVRAQITARLHDEHLVLWEKTLTVDRPIAETENGDLPLETVEALGDAMQTLVDQVADNVVRTLGARRSVDATPGVVSR